MSNNKLIMLDTETTGLKPQDGHRIIEIGALAVINREVTELHYHQYINPMYAVDEEALAVHGLSNEFLADKPLFETIVDEFLAFVTGAELVIHNAPFDVGFINHELSLCGKQIRIEDICTITDSLDYAKKKHPGAKNNLDALCKRYGIGNDHRTLHGALLDSEILAQVYLAMTGGQTKLNLDTSQNSNHASFNFDLSDLPALKVVKPSEEEMQSHEQWLEKHSSDDNQFIYQSTSGAKQLN
ncbi:DNA polymerase III subunit epsilon [Marinicella sp. S1101]|uniref:DNA polymerase III subunit epsilon n=1 Tax=Marinicella marina TaxID=2996016 RepID=UPI002260A402|nr:DNA polymerase III subunit epsilon [Marinicella marina]MCX7554084.1 DNA polymerase III subunit epsilon [Marinicella marina]MDJ1141223.1 DNA polymerase III subunit epsilon [Marinicella marina]